MDVLALLKQLWSDPGAIERLAGQAAQQGDPMQFSQGITSAKAAMPEWDAAQAQGQGQQPVAPQQPQASIGGLLQPAQADYNMFGDRVDQGATPDPMLARQSQEAQAALAQPGQDDALRRAAEAFGQIDPNRFKPERPPPFGGGPALGAAKLAGSPIADLFAASGQPPSLGQLLRNMRF
jgi:hypothetical protein